MDFEGSGESESSAVIACDMRSVHRSASVGYAGVDPAVYETVDNVKKSEKVRKRERKDPPRSPLLGGMSAGQGVNDLFSRCFTIMIMKIMNNLMIFNENAVHNIKF